MDSSKKKLIIGLICLIFGMAMVVQGGYFYQNAIAGVIYDIVSSGTPASPTYILNMSMMALLLNIGLLVTITGIVLAIMSKND